MNPTNSTTPLYKTEFIDFDDLTAVLEQLPVKFIDHSWHNDSCPNFQFAAEEDGAQLAYPRLMLWIDYADTAKAQLAEFASNNSWRPALEDLADFAVGRQA